METIGLQFYAGTTQRKLPWRYPIAFAIAICENNYAASHPPSPVFREFSP